MLFHVFTSPMTLTEITHLVRPFIHYGWMGDARLLPGADRDNYLVSDTQTSLELMQLPFNLTTLSQ
jgi:hypothetical protein